VPKEDAVLSGTPGTYGTNAPDSDKTAGPEPLKQGGMATVDGAVAGYRCNTSVAGSRRTECGTYQTVSAEPPEVFKVNVDENILGGSVTELE
jgi:hypothetical protein